MDCTWREVYSASEAGFFRSLAPLDYTDFQPGANGLDVQFANGPLLDKIKSNMAITPGLFYPISRPLHLTNRRDDTSAIHEPIVAITDL